MRNAVRIVAVLASLVATAALAFQDPAPVKRVVEDFLRVQTKGLPGRVSFTVSAVDPGNQLASCPAALEASQAPGSRLWGKVTVTVRCPVDGGWTLFVPVQVRVVVDYLVAARPLTQRQVLTDADLARQTGDLSDLPAGTLTEPAQAVGHQTTLAIAAGQPLRADMLRQVLVVLQNQAVKVVSKGPGFQVANDGRALNNGVEGQVVQVRLGNGQVVSGIARNGGVVEVTY